MCASMQPHIRVGHILLFVENYSGYRFSHPFKHVEFNGAHLNQFLAAKIVEHDISRFSRYWVRRFFLQGVAKTKIQLYFGPFQSYGM